MLERTYLVLMKRCLPVSLNNPKIGHKIYLQVVGLHFALMTKFSKSENIKDTQDINWKKCNKKLRTTNKIAP